MINERITRLLQLSVLCTLSADSAAGYVDHLQIKIVKK
jgi:hypothetical protein